MSNADYRRYLEYFANGVKFSSAVFHHLGFATIDQHYGTTHTAQVQGLIALIENQHERVCHG